VSFLLVLLIVLLLFGGGIGFAGPANYRNGGWGLGGIVLLLIILDLAGIIHL
jgi:hypothetical protein